MIGHLPLWVVVYIWAAQRQNAPRVNFFNYPQLLRLIEDMRNSLPIPRGKTQTYLVTKVLEWLDGERRNILTLRDGNVIATGIIGK